MMIDGAGFMLIICFVNVINTDASGIVLQLTDFHYDADYNATSGNSGFFCHHDPKGDNTPLDEFGNFVCDSPKALVRKTLDEVKRIVPHADYVFWTGDNMPHIPNDMYTMENVFQTIQNVTDMIQSLIIVNTTTKIFPVFGNHDYWPSDAFTDHNTTLYRRIYGLWRSWIGDDTGTTFNLGGYYQYRINRNTVLLALNTNLYYVFNDAYDTFENKTDPAGQFAFMESVLQNAINQSLIVHIIAHIAPGVFERNSSYKWFRPEYNQRFLQIIVQYNQVIKWMIFGHHHSDTFHLVKDKSDDAIQLMLLAPSVTPWSKNNPSFRTILYDDESSWNINDIITYSIDLDVLNKNRSTQFTVEYSMVHDYNLSIPIDAHQMQQLLDRMKTNASLFDQYIRYNSVMHTTSVGESKQAQLCSIEFVDYDQYDRCLGKVSPSSSSTITTAYVIIMSMLFITIVFCFIIV